MTGTVATTAASARVGLTVQQRLRAPVQQPVVLVGDSFMACAVRRCLRTLHALIRAPPRPT